MPIGFYRVEPGDALYQILRSHYGDAAFLRDRNAVSRLVQDSNPSIVDIDLIYPGQIIVLPPFGQDAPPVPQCHAPITAAPRGQSDANAGAPAKAPPPPLRPEELEALKPIQRKLETLDTVQQSLFSDFDMYKAGQLGDGVFRSFVGRQMKASRREVLEIIKAYELKQTGLKTRGQYDYTRKKSVEIVKKTLGPMNKLINPGKAPREVLRIDRSHIARTNKLMSAANQFQRIGRLAGSGNFILGAANFGVTLSKIDAADTDTERTEILIADGSQQLGSTLGGIGTGMLFVAVFGTPVGWVGLAVLAVTATTGGLMVGEGSKAVTKAIANQTLYDENGNRVRTTVDGWWDHVPDLW